MSAKKFGPLCRNNFRTVYQKPCGERGESAFRDCAIRLGLSESALKSAVHRMRQRYRELVREEVAHTVNDPAEVQAEIQHLIAVVGG